jgi:outer membrane protein with beta-barrel domain
MSFLRTAAVLMLAAVTPAPAGAQVLIGMLLGSKLASETFNIGLEIGMNLPTVHGLAGAASTRGFLLGLFASWRFSEHVHLFTGLAPLSSKGAQGADPVPLGDDALDPLVAGGTMTRDLDYMDIPVLLQYAPKRDDGLRIGAGPQFGILLSARDRYLARSPQGTDVVVEQDIEGQLERFDVGVAFDAEYRFAGLGLAIGVRWFNGRTNILRDDAGPSMYNRVLSGSGRISLGARKPKPPPRLTGSRVASPAGTDRRQGPGCSSPSPQSSTR